MLDLAALLVRAAREKPQHPPREAQQQRRASPQAQRLLWRRSISGSPRNSSIASSRSCRRVPPEVALVPGRADIAARRPVGERVLALSTPEASPLADGAVVLAQRKGRCSTAAAFRPTSGCFGNAAPHTGQTTVTRVKRALRKTQFPSLSISGVAAVSQWAVLAGSPLLPGGLVDHRCRHLVCRRRRAKRLAHLAVFSPFCLRGGRPLPFP